jgi:hypothetical protein
MTTAAWVGVIGLIVSIVVTVLTLFIKGQEKANAFVVAFVSLALAVGVATWAEVYDGARQQAVLLERAVPTIESQNWNAIVRDIAEYDRQQVAASTPNPFEDLVHRPLQRVILQTLQQVREGNIVLRTLPETVDLATTLMEGARRSVRATSYVRPSEWWDTQEGKSYAARSASVPKGQVRIFERIFIVALDDNVSSLMRLGGEQEKNGIDVRFVCAATLPQDERSDFIVIDSAVAAELNLDNERRFQRAHFYPTETRAKDLEQRFKLLWIRGRRLADGFKGC